MRATLISRTIICCIALCVAVPASAAVVKFEELKPDQGDILSGEITVKCAMRIQLTPQPGMWYEVRAAMKSTVGNTVIQWRHTDRRLGDYPGATQPAWSLHWGMSWPYYSTETPDGTHRVWAGFYIRPRGEGPWTLVGGKANLYTVDNSGRR